MCCLRSEPGAGFRVRWVEVRVVFTKAPRSLFLLSTLSEEPNGPSPAGTAFIRCISIPSGPLTGEFFAGRDAAHILRRVAQQIEKGGSLFTCKAALQLLALGPPPDVVLPHGEPWYEEVNAFDPAWSEERGIGLYKWSGLVDLIRMLIDIRVSCHLRWMKSGPPLNPLCILGERSLEGHCPQDEAGP